MEPVIWQRTYPTGDLRILSTFKRLQKRDIWFSVQRPSYPFHKVGAVTITAEQYTYKQERFLKHLNFEVTNES